MKEGDVIGFWRTIPTSPRGNFDRRSSGPTKVEGSRRSPAVRVCARGIVRRLVSRHWVILHHPETNKDVQIATRNVIGLWDQITDQTLFEIRMANRAKARAAKERRNARDMQFRKQLILPFA